MTDDDPLAHIRVGDPDPCPPPLVTNGPFCGARHPRDGEWIDPTHRLWISCTRKSHPPQWAHIAAAGRPEPGQYVADGIVQPGPHSGRVGGVVATWHEETGEENPR